MTLEVPDTGRDGRAAITADEAELRWDGSPSRYTDAEYAKACVLDRGPDAGTAKQRYSLPVANPGNAWTSPDPDGVHAAAGRIGQVSAPADVKKAAAKRLVRCYGIIKEDAPDALKSLAGMSEKASGEGEVRFVVASIAGVEVRDPVGTPDDTWTMSGYAAVFDQTTTLYDGKMLKVTESIDPGFFDEVLRTQGLTTPAGVVHFNLGHDMSRAVAATNVPPGEPGWLDLKPDTHGLGYMAKVARSDPDAVAMASKMRTGVLRQASFAFTIAEAKWETTEADDGPDVDHHTLIRAKHLYDVCACPQGAYPQTSSDVRSISGSRDPMVFGLLQYAAAIGYPVDLVEREAAIARQLGIARGASTISVPETGGRGQDELAKARLKAQAHARAARHRHPGG
jgi:HK97 family phage prohead protease